MFSLKDPSLLAFNQRRRDANLKVRATHRNALPLSPHSFSSKPKFGLPDGWPVGYNQLSRHEARWQRLEPTTGRDGPPWSR